MDFWIAAQIGVDLLLFGMIALLLIRDRSVADDADEEIPPPPAPPPPVDTAVLEALLDDMARMVNRAEKVAVRLETAGKEAARLQTALEQTPPPPPPSPQPKAKAKPKPGAKEEYDESVYQAAVKLIKKGHSDDAIGQKVGLPSHEVGLIRRMGV